MYPTIIVKIDPKTNFQYQDASKSTLKSQLTLFSASWPPFWINESNGKIIFLLFTATYGT